MKIAVPAELDPAEPRVAATPETVKKIRALGADVAVESGAGVKSGVRDAEYAAAGATVAPSAADAVKDADVVLKVRRPGPAELELGKVAEKWADRILHPPSRASKLGVKAGLSVRVVVSICSSSTWMRGR